MAAIGTADRPTTNDALRGYAVAAVACAAAAGLQYAVQPVIGTRPPFAIFSVAVALAAWAGGSGPGLFATLLGTSTGLWVAGHQQTGLEAHPPAVIFGMVAFATAGMTISFGMRGLHRRALAERASRREAERSLHHATHLQELTAALSRAKTPADVRRSALVELSHAVSAETALFGLTSEDSTSYDVACVIGAGERAAQDLSGLPLSARTPVTEALRRQELVVLESPAVGDLEYPDRRSDPLLAASESAVVVPLLRAGRAFGAIALSFGRPRTFEGDERQFLWAAAGRVTQAIDRAQVYEATEHARAEAEAFRMRADEELRERQRAEALLRESEAKYRALATRTNRLYELNAGLSEAVSVSAVAKVIVHQGKAVVGASAGGVSIVVDGGRAFETLHTENFPREVAETWRRFGATDGLLSTQVVQTRQPVFVTSFVDWQKRFPASATAAADGGFGSAAALPLLIENSVMGVLVLTFTAPVNFDAGYTTLLRSVAQHCAQALDRARLYESTQAARTAAEEANRSKDEFLSTVSHELRTPLNAMLGWASLLRNGSLDPSRTSRALEAVFNNATRQANLIEELLDVSRIVAGRAPLDPQPLDLADNVRGAIEAIMPLADAKGLDVRVTTVAKVTVRADPRRLEQVFLNLLSNAVKFTPAGGRVAITMSASETVVDVRVADSGTGIDPGFLPHVFERFRQADSTMARSVGGLGLGLFIARHLVEAQNGRISVHSDGPGRGSTFTVSLPVMGLKKATAENRPSPPAAARHSEDSPSLVGIRVLLVDDEPDTREVMASTLEACGATVLSAACAADALHTLRRAPVDVLLADLAMPGTDGYGLIREIRSQSTQSFSAVPAAAVTASARDDERQRALDAGFQIHLAKPVRPAVLASTVARLARTRVSGVGPTPDETEPHWHTIAPTLPQ